MLFDISQETTFDFVPLKYRNLFLKEVRLDDAVSTKSRSLSTDAKKVVEWLDIWRFLYPEAELPSKLTPGKYDQQAAAGVMILQEKWGMPATGEVEEVFYSQLCSPMAVAFQKSLVELGSIREAIVHYANQHHRSRPLETFGKEDNHGPWVRAYLNLYKTSPKNEWCAGFVCTILDQAFSHFGEDYSDYLDRTAWVPNFSVFGYAHDAIIPHDQALNRAEEIQAGDVFMYYDPENSLWSNPQYATIRRDRYIHTGLVGGMEGSILTTIEGNKNFGTPEDVPPTQESLDEAFAAAAIPSGRGGVFSRKFDLADPDNRIAIVKLNV